MPEDILKMKGTANGSFVFNQDAVPLFSEFSRVLRKIGTQTTIIPKPGVVYCQPLHSTHICGFIDVLCSFRTPML